MLLHYLKSSVRSLLRNWSYTSINLVSLSIGFCAFLILWPYTNNELNSDKWHEDSDRIVRLSTHLEWTDDNVNWNGWYSGSNMAGTGMLIKERFAQVTELTRYIPQENFKPHVQGSGQKVIWERSRKRNPPRTAGGIEDIEGKKSPVSSKEYFTPDEISKITNVIYQ